jgi:1-acyl-sn-glycerol-3-phosphate acyltransferase
MGYAEPQQANEERRMAQPAEEILKLVGDLAVELHPRLEHTINLTLDSALDRELGFDSLSRVELLVRLERHFGVTLPERVMATAESPRDLLRAVLDAKSADEVETEAGPDVGDIALDEVQSTPRSAETLLDVLEWHVNYHPNRTHVHLYGDGDKPTPISYAGLLQSAREIAGGLLAEGLQPGRCVAIMLPTSLDYLASFFGVLIAGGVPVPIYPPARLSQLEDHLRRHAGILNNALASVLITVPEAKTVVRLLKSQVAELRSITTPAELRAGGGEIPRPALKSQDLAFLQYTSGSTGAPKGVMLTHANLLANIRVMGEAIRVDATDVFVSWLPLYHDMGLIGAWLGSLYYAFPLVLMSPLTFISRPHRWLQTIHRHRGTLSASPNFGYELCVKRIEDADIQGIDLSSWRFAFNGAESVSPQTVRNFTERFQPYGFRPETMAPVYGLAECSVGLAFPPLGRGPLIDRVRREDFVSSGEAVPAEESDSEALEFVACGQPLPRHQVRIVDPSGRELPERREGRLQFRGPSTTSGYYRNPEQTRRLFDGAWLDSGDLAYVAGGDIFLTSRVKDIIIRAGRNIYPYEVEEAVSELEGIRRGCVAVFGSTDSRSGTEKVVVLAETRETDTKALAMLEAEVRTVATDLMGTPPDDVVLAPPQSVLKTSSGKIRRAASRELYERGRLGKRPRAVWWQMMRLSLAAVLPELRRMRRMSIDLLYAGYAWAVFGAVAAASWLAVVCLPRLEWRWSAVRAASRLSARLTATPLRVEGLENLVVDKPCVIVANHSSYLDPVALIAALPVTPHFVAKAELRDSFSTRVPLNRLQTRFVERFDQQQGISDARRTADAVRQGHSLIFFPEGTFGRVPGLLPFHMGAFVAAAEASAPVVPVVIRGTRSILRSDSWFPRRGAVMVTVCEAIVPHGRDWNSAVSLRNQARQEILDHLGEPDLTHQDSPL